MAADYIRWIRSKVGHERIMLTFAGGWVEDNRGRVLLQKRSAENEVWGFPGGSIELGESAEEAAIREIKEETGLDVRVDALLGIYSKYNASYANGDQAQAIVITFRCSILGGELKTDQRETFALQFVEPANAPPLFCQQHQDILTDGMTGRNGFFR